MPSWTSTRKLALLLAPPGQDPPRFLCWNLTLPQKHFLADGLLSAPKCFSEMCLPVSAPCEIYSPSLQDASQSIEWAVLQFSIAPPTRNRGRGSMLKCEYCGARLQGANNSKKPPPLSKGFCCFNGSLTNRGRCSEPATGLSLVTLREELVKGLKEPDSLRGLCGIQFQIVHSRVICTHTPPEPREKPRDRCGCFWQEVRDLSV